MHQHVERTTLKLRMTAGYYVGALMRPEASEDEREQLRALAVYGLYTLKEQDSLGEVRSIPNIDAEAFTI